MFERMKRTAAQYPYLTVIVGGFCVMIVPIVVCNNLLYIGQFLANEGRSTSWIDMAMLNLLRVCLSTPVQAIGSIIVALGFVTMCAGLALHVRHRRANDVKDVAR